MKYLLSLYFVFLLALNGTEYVKASMIVLDVFSITLHIRGLAQQDETIPIQLSLCEANPRSIKNKLLILFLL